MNPRLQKVDQDIAKLTHRLQTDQAKLDALMALKTELENTEILNLVRSVHATPEELQNFIVAFRTQAHPNPFTAPNQEDHHEPEDY